jgi:hypothetical protein
MVRNSGSISEGNFLTSLMTLLSELFVTCLITSLLLSNFLSKPLSSLSVLLLLLIFRCFPFPLYRCSFFILKFRNSIIEDNYVDNFHGFPQYRRDRPQPLPNLVQFLPTLDTEMERCGRKDQD